jgi:hypothetical protein
MASTAKPERRPIHGAIVENENASQRLLTILQAIDVALSPPSLQPERDAPELVTDDIHGEISIDGNLFRTTRDLLQADNIVRKLAGTLGIELPI